MHGLLLLVTLMMFMNASQIKPQKEGSKVLKALKFRRIICANVSQLVQYIPNLIALTVISRQAISFM